MYLASRISYLDVKTMRRFTLFSLWVFLSAIFPPMAAAAAVGFFAGTFDPPTQAEIALVRCALGEAGMRPQCGEIGAPLARVVISIKESSDGDTLASARERALMVQRALQKYAGRVEIVTAAGNPEQTARDLLRDRNVEQLVRFIDADSYRALEAAAVTQDPKLQWVIFLLKPEQNPTNPKTLPANVKLLSPIAQGGTVAEVRKPLPGGGTTNITTDPQVKNVIDRLSLYQEVGDDLAPLQRSLFDESWTGFVRDLKYACPSVVNDKDCAALAAYWQRVAIVDPTQTNTKDASSDLLIYKRAQSEDRWAEKFTETAMRPLRGSASYGQFKPVAEDMSSKVYEGYPEGKLFHLRKVFVQARPAKERPKLSENPVPCTAPPGKYNMNIVEYTTDRFPEAFAAFLKAEFRRGPISPADLYVHNRTVQEAYEFHRRDGYNIFYFLQTRRGQLHRDIYLAVKPNPRSYRVVFTNVRGRDQAADVFCQISRSGTFSRYHSVESKPGLPLFVFNPTGLSLKLNAKDWLLFGFKGKWEKVLREQNWQRQPLVQQGLDIDLFTHPTVKQRLVIARNVYGDDANIIIDTFYRKGVRQVIYLGTAGAIAGYRVGAVVTPDEFIDNNGVSAPFRQNLAHAYNAELAKQVTVHDQTKHGRVPTIYHETLALLLNWKEKSIAAMDVEGFYLAQFANRHKDLKMAALFVISDQTLGASTIDDSEARLDVIDDSVYKLVGFFLPKVVGPQ
jgi:phosphopantetheine adenylyltransferase